MERVATMERITINLLLLGTMNLLFFVAFVTFLLNFPSLRVFCISVVKFPRYGFEFDPLRFFR
jgi:hypothetical protein